MLPLLLLLLPLAACGASDRGADRGADPGAAPVAPHLSAIETEVFAVSCTFSACHGALAAQQGLSLVRPTFGQIVDQPAAELSEGLRVAPGAPERSYLLAKITDDHPAVGQRMPPGQPLAAPLIAGIRQWILDGAADD